LVAPDAAQALQIAKQYPGQIQLLLTDINLQPGPGAETGGKDIAALLSALRPEMKVLFMSGHAHKALTGDGALDGDANFIEKPWSPRELCEKVQAVLSASARAATLRVLVVDDEPGMLDWLSDVLQECGHRVFTAPDGLKALRLARREPLDLVITDISMPDEDGIGTVCALRKMQPSLNIVAMSGSNADALIDAKLLGASATLTKPFSAEALLKCIRGLAPADPPLGASKTAG
jgi:DNA-binding response OmpR family regulator